MQSFMFYTWLASLAATATAIASSNSSASNFSQSCTGVNLTENNFLNASCTYPTEDNAGDAPALTQNHLDLAMCIGIDQIDGGLQWEVYGKFSNYCYNCEVHTPVNTTGYHLACRCVPMAGVQRALRTTLNLDEGIVNDMGTLKCTGGMASSTNETETDGY